MAGGYCVYVLWSPSAGRFYTGSTADLSDRLRRHNSGLSKATRYGVPWQIVHVESFAARSEAVQRELYFKSGRGRDELRQLLSRPA